MLFKVDERAHARLGSGAPARPRAQPNMMGENGPTKRTETVHGCVSPRKARVGARAARAPPYLWRRMRCAYSGD